MPVYFTLSFFLDLHLFQSREIVRKLKVFNLFFCLLFIVFAALQYNDPDPYLWIPIYLYTALLCWLAFKNRFYPFAYIFGIIGYLIYGIFLFFTKDGVGDWFTQHHAENIVATMQAQKPWIEDAREFFGLLILIVVLLINFMYAKRKKRRSLNAERASFYSHT